MRLILKHKDSLYNAKRYLGKNIIEYSDDKTLKEKIREIVNSEEYKSNKYHEIFIVTKNVDNKNKDQFIQKRLLYSDVDTYIYKPRDDEYPAGMFYYVKVICNYIHHLRDMMKDLIFIIDLYDLWGCKNGYNEFFNETKTIGCDVDTDDCIYQIQLEKVPFLFEANNFHYLMTKKYIDRTKFLEFQKINVTTINDLIYRTDYLLNYNISDNFFSIKNEINNECENIFNKYIDKNKIKIILHVRSPCHFIGVEDTKYYDSFIDTITSVFFTQNNINKNNYICIIFGDSKYSINQLKIRLEKINMNYFVFNEDRTDLSTENVDWCIELKPEYNRYKGTVYDVCLMSKGDYLIGGKSNIIMYIINYNKNIKFILPKYQMVNVY